MNRIIATVDLPEALSARLASSSFQVEILPTISHALELYRQGGCAAIVMMQPATWSLTRIGGQVSASGADGRTIVLTSLGSTFSPGLYVLGDRVSAESLTALVERIVRIPAPRLTATAIPESLFESDATL
jgi:hypothetical protein